MPCEIIDYRKDAVIELYRIYKPLNCRYNFITNIYNALYYRKLARRKSSFEFFRKTELALSAERYKTKHMLDQSIDKYDMLICGSDQIWNMDIVDFDTTFLLDFKNFHGKRIAYAASMGPAKKALQSIKPYRELFDQFDCITVREKATKEAIEQITTKQITVTIDPVFLLDKNEWNAIGNKSTANPGGAYVLCYFPGGVTKSMEKFSRDLAKKHNCRRVLIMSEWRNMFRTGKKFYDCTPWDFLKLIQDAKFVCTTSFHGTAFSIIFDKCFFVESVGKCNDSRINSLLSMVEKTDCIINMSSDLDGSFSELSQLIDSSKNIINSFIIPTGVNNE